MKIYFDGCAKTCGTALKHDIKQRYSTLLCDKLGAEEYNIARDGSSNRRLVRNLIEHDLSNYDLFIIQMSKRDRFEWFDKKKNEWNNVSRSRKIYPLTHGHCWEYYYNNIYSDEMGIIDEKISFAAIKNLLGDKKHVIISISNSECGVPVDIIYRKGKDFTSNFGIDRHKMIVDNILDIL